MASGDYFSTFPYYREFYVESIRHCTSSAIRSAARVHKWLDPEKVSDDPTRRVRVEKAVLDELQNMILQGGALSKFFWPITKSAPHLQRGETLRQMYGIDDSNPLKSRQLRNALEHFDERLDLYLQKPIVGYVLTHYVGPFDEGDGVPVHLFRAFYTDTAVFEILGERHEIEPIFEAIEQLHGRLPE